MKQDSESGNVQAAHNAIAFGNSKEIQSFSDILQNPLPKHPPFFMDVTLRDGNQALRKPWNLDTKGNDL